MRAVPALTAYAKLASPTFTGTPAAPTAAVDTNTTQLATTAFVIAQAYAKLASPTFTGTPAAPTAAPGTNTTQLATTAYADAIAALKANIASPTFTGTATSPTYTATTKFLMPDGTASVPGIGFTTEDDGTGTGFYKRTVLVITGTSNGTGCWELRSDYMAVPGTSLIGWNNGAITQSIDTAMVRAAANSIQFGASLSTAISRTELNKSVTGIADAAATAALTITIPNAAHSASLRVRVTGSLGAGGAIGANEATAVNEYIISLTRTAGVNATAAISAAYGSAATAVAGAATVTCAAALSAVSGAVGASNSFTVNVTITKSGGASTNHTCLVYAQLTNANATGVTIA